MADAELTSIVISFLESVKNKPNISWSIKNTSGHITFEIACSVKPVNRAYQQPRPVSEVTVAKRDGKKPKSPSQYQRDRLRFQEFKRRRFARDIPPRFQSRQHHSTPEIPTSDEEHLVCREEPELNQATETPATDSPAPVVTPTPLTPVLTSNCSALESQPQDPICIKPTEQTKTPFCPAPTKIVSELTKFWDTLPVHSPPSRCFSVTCKQPSSTGLMKCTRCKVASYCTKDCQVADWPIHRRVCNAS